MQKKVIIVEDDSFLQGLAVTKLQKEGYEVSSASNSDELFKILETVKPDIFLMDLVFPGLGGFGSIKKIKENLILSQVPMIIFSNLAEDKDFAQAEALGVPANNFMVKSNFTLEELVERIKTLVK
jgi:DNA-binding response OmpR family regulator